MERLGDLTQAMKNQSARYTAGRFLQAHAIGKGNISNALGFAEEQRQWLDRAQIVDALKSAVSPIATGDFPGALTPVAESFLAAMRDASIPLRLQGLRRVPMLTRLYVNAQGVIAAQVAEGQPIPVLQGDWTATTLEPRKFAGLTVQTDELLRLLSPTAALAIVDDLARATAEAENDAFLNADTPGSVLYGQTGLTAAGSSLANADSDLRLLIGAVRGASDPNAAFVMSKTTATFLGTLRGTGGAPAYPNIGPSGGELLGLQVLISSVAEDADSPTTKIIALLSPSEILWADEGRVVLTTSKNASLQMSDTPSASATTAVSMWQSNSTATRAIRESSWYARGRCCLPSRSLLGAAMSTFDPQAMAGQVVEAARGFIQRALAPLQEDMRGALQRLDKHAQALESAERRLSRHGEHLARLESRLQRLEHGGDK